MHSSGSAASLPGAARFADFILHKPVSFCPQVSSPKLCHVSSRQRFLSNNITRVTQPRSMPCGPFVTDSGTMYL
jgi:hypothetical protein